MAWLVCNICDVFYWQAGTAHASSEVEEDALTSSLQLASASGSLESLLGYVASLLRLKSSSKLSAECWTLPIGPTHGEKAKATIQSLQDAVADADERYASWARVVSVVAGPLENFGFDIPLCGSQSLEFSNQNRTVSSLFV